LEHFDCVIPLLPAQGCEQGGSVCNGQGRPKKRASLHHTSSSGLLISYSSLTAGEVALWPDCLNQLNAYSEDSPFLAKTPQVLIGADKNLPVTDSAGGQNAFADLILGDDLERWIRL